MIRGFCIGGGLAIALNADIRISCELGQFGIPAARLGVGYGYKGIKQLMNLVGPSYTKEIFFTGRRFSASEALQMSLVNRVVSQDDLQKTVEDYANTIADNAPNVLRATTIERVDWLSWKRGSQTFKDDEQNFKTPIFIHIGADFDCMWI